MRRPTLSVLSLSLLILAGGASSAEAYTNRRVDETYSRSAGNEWAGASFEAYFRALPAGLNGGVSEVDARAHAEVTVLRNHLNIIDARVRGRTPGSTEAYLTLGSWDVFHFSRNYSWSREGGGTYELPAVTATFWGIVRVRASAGVHYGFRVEAHVSPAGTRGNLTLSGSVFGRASAGVTLLIAGADLEAELRFLSPELGASLLADVGGVTASATLCFEPVRLLLHLVAWVDYFWDTAEYRWTLVDWSAPRTCRTLFRY